MLVDTHLHLDDKDCNVDEVIKNAHDVSVDYLIVAGSDINDNKFNSRLVSCYDNIFMCAGFHPCMANNIVESDFVLLENIISKNSKVVAIGEIGLDYYYGKDNKEEQIQLFKRQLDLAVKYKLPVVIHTRDAFLDTYNILREYDLTGVIHCFSGSIENAHLFISLGYYLGIGGVVTFKNSKLRDVVRQIGLKNVVLETDSPYLSPFRGQKNEPCNVAVICKYIADLLNVSAEEVAKITSLNAKTMFDLDI